MTSQPGAELRHPLATRLTHWLFFFSFVALVGTGLQIFNGQAYLRIAHQRDAAHTIASIRSPHEGEAVISVLGHATRIQGWPRWTADPHGELRPQYFPNWLVIPFGQDKRGGQILHRWVSWPLLFAGLIYIGARVRRGDLGDLLLYRADLPKLFPMLLYELRLRRQPPPYGKYNPLQKLAYSFIVFVCGPVIVVTGYAAWGHRPFLEPLTALFGGRDAARFWHTMTMLVMLAFLVVHVTMVVTTGLVTNLRAMITGWRHRAEPHPAATEPILAAES
jgi:thiosulfate reductase cytochrome b subunit